MRFFKMKFQFMNSILKRELALAVMILITVSSVITVAASTCNAHINYNGSKKSVQLLSSSTGDILAAAGFEAGAKDLVTREVKDSGGEIYITVKSAYNVKITADGAVKTVTAHYGDTVSDVISAAGITPGANDSIVPSAATKASDGMDIEISRNVSMTVTADGKTSTVLVAKGSVAKALSQAGITLGSEDVVSAGKTAEVSDGMKLTIARVAYREVKSTQSIAYTNTNVNDKTKTKGTKKIQTIGKNGSKSVVMRQKLIDGKVAGSELVESTVIAPPVNQVTLVGTKKKAGGYATIESDGTLTDANGNTVSYRKVISGRCSAYTGGGWTSTGRSAAFGLVAVNPNLIPYGSKLYICSADGRTVYGYAIAADTGGGVMSGRIVADLYYDTEGQCQRFGVKNMRIYVIG